MRDGHVGYDGVFGIPLSLSCECMYNRRLCPAGGSGDGDDGNIGIPRRCHPSGENHPCGQKNRADFSDCVYRV